jgi:fucose 4-O-acetylase-like acetyltransferase
MGPVRIFLFLIWFAAIFLWVERNAQRINRLTLGFIDLLGRNSLFVYVAHAFIVFIFRLFVPGGTQLFANFAITAAALALLIGTTYYYNKFQAARKAKLAGFNQAKPKAQHILKAKPAES